MLKAQDLLVILKLCVWPRKQSWSFPKLASSICLSLGETHNAVKRCTMANLYNPLTKRPVNSNLLEFLFHGMKYVFPAEETKVTRGMRTGPSADFLGNELMVDETTIYVWPYAHGLDRGQGIKPLYKSVPEACAKDKELYLLLVYIDCLRMGRVREKDIAKIRLSHLLDGNFP